MPAPAFNDRVEKKFELGIEEKDIAALWRSLTAVLRPYGLEPVQEITSVGSVYFDNKDCDLLRFSLLGHLMLFRTRVYEMYGSLPEPISEYWVEVKTAQGSRRRKRRFPLSKAALYDFLDGKNMAHNFAQRGEPGIDELYHTSQETVLTMGLKPILLVMYKRIAFQSDTCRVSIDWDVEYYHASISVYETNSWKYLVDPIAGRPGKVILEIKCVRDEGAPPWFSELEQRYPIRQREYLKPIEGMGYLFQGPLKNHKEVDYFVPRISAYLKNSLLG